MSIVKIMFTDLDGTCVHYEGFEDAEAARLLALPPSTTGRVGAISAGALERYAAARAAGAALVVVSGARTPTLFTRLPLVPAADAYVSENGGRIFYPADVARRLGDALIEATARGEEGEVEEGRDKEGGGGGSEGGEAAAQQGPRHATTAPLPTACPLVEDLAWRRALQGVCGPASEEGRGVPPEGRTGPLWAFYRRLADAGWRVDAQGYATAFRVQGGSGAAAALSKEAEGAEAAAGGGGAPAGGGGDEEEDAKVAAEAALRAVAASRPAGVACSTNLGVLDFYPSRSGKEGAARRLERLFLAAAEAETAGGGPGGRPSAGVAPPVLRTAFLCDDDNDLALAARVGRAFVPTFGSASMEAAVRAEQHHAAEAVGGGAAAAAHFVTPAAGLDARAAGASAAARCAAATEEMVEAASAWLGEREEDEEDRGCRDGAAVAATAAAAR